MRHVAFLLVIALSPTSLLAMRPSVPTPAIVDTSLSENFTVDSKTTIPGKDLMPGDYKITIIEHLSDRVILQITNKQGKVVSTFLGIIGGFPASGAAFGPVRWNGKGTPALRGFTFPGAAPVEFVYPKGQAVTIAKGNDEKVLAIDPASDNLSSSQGSLSNQDMQIVTLWSLKASRVGPDATPAIEAVRYQMSAQAPAPAPVYVARATPPPAPAPSSVRTLSSLVKSSPAPVKPELAPTRSTPQLVAGTSQQPHATAPVARRHAIAVLPHTASNLPLMVLGAVLALFGSAALRLRRVYGL